MNHVIIIAIIGKISIKDKKKNTKKSYTSFREVPVK